MSKVKVTDKAWIVKCPARGEIRVPRDGRWTFDGNMDKPTFAPSINETIGKEGQTHAELASNPAPDRNHFYIKCGHVEYLPDSTHNYRGLTYALAEVDA